MIYGTAWKYGNTTETIEIALKAGFRRLDSAAQRPQYREDLVGRAIKNCCETGILIRKDLWIQSKFTHSGDQLQENLRYDFNLGLEDQVRCSFISSLDDLGLSGLPLQEAYLDSYLLHAPLPTATSTFTVWSAMEELVPHHVRSIGVSNVPLAILKRIFDNSRIKPMIVQNRFVPELDYDADVRAFCKDNNIHYQAFGVLKSSGTSALLESSLVKALAVENMVSEESVLYYLIEESLGIEVLNGVPDSRRIIKDLEDIAILRGSTSLPSRCVDWSGVWDEFRELLHPNTIIKSQVQAT